MSMIFQREMYFDYEEKRCYLKISYDQKAHVVTIRGGLHAMAYLAELCAYNASSAEENDHDHWHNLMPDSLQLTLTLREQLPK